ncbi:MAG TPA: excinuclease ABC subunit C [Terracidiphilus sp.]|nr:excinuclease ABC subunit C [Terracidiphilus sp.]
MDKAGQDRETAVRSYGALREQIAFDPANPKATLSSLPQTSAVFALYGPDAHEVPYIGRTPNLRSRLERLLQPSPKHPRRLQLAGRVRRIAWRLTGSEFESLLVQFELLQNVYGAKALERMHLRHPAFVRFLGGNPYPRVTVTFRPSLRQADWAYGPFPSRAAAERFIDEALKLFLLRRCTFELAPDPGYPGCVYSEMKMCLAPCFKGCTDARYAEEASAVEQFLATRGESRLAILRAERDQASANLEFERAAALHAQAQRVESVRALAAELVRPLSRLRAVILQPSANSDEVALFLFENGRLRGPAAFSTLGMRIQNEQSGSSSLFAQPMAVEPVPEETGNREPGRGNRDQGMEIGIQGSTSTDEGSEKTDEGSAVIGATGSEAHARVSRQAAKLARGMLESRLDDVLAALSQPAALPSATERQGHLALLKRWYYRPEGRRTGEIFFSDAEGHWPVKAVLRGIGRVAAKMLATGA